jgi:molecular chaperone DnaK
MEQLGDKMDAGEKSSLEASIKELEEALKTEDKGRIESLAKALGEVSGKMAERLYAQNQPGPEAGPGPGPGQDGGQGGGGGKDDVVDAEFEEVKDGRK